MIGSRMMCLSVVVLLVGMLAGIVMGIQQNFVLAPAHAHLNLVGGVLLFLFGLYYKLVPAAGTTTLAKVQGWLHMIGAVLFPAGVAIVILKGPSFEAAPILGSLIVVAAMALFAVIVFRTSQA
jgi:hypothetical protein